MHASNAHVSVGLNRGFVMPSSIRISRRGLRRASSAPISAASGIIGGMVVGAAMWITILSLAL